MRELGTIPKGRLSFQDRLPVSRRHAAAEALTAYLESLTEEQILEETKALLDYGIKPEDGHYCPLAMITKKQALKLGLPFHQEDIHVGTTLLEYCNASKSLSPNLISFIESYDHRMFPNEYYRDESVLPEETPSHEY